MPLDQVELDEQYEVKAVKEMGFFQHLEELRRHIIRSLIVVVVLMIVVFTQKEFIFQTIVFGPKSPDFVTYRFMANLADKTGWESLRIAPPNFNTVSTDLGEAFFMHMQVAFVLGFVLAFPYIFWEFWRFVRPGLMEREAKMARGIVGICSSLFLFGVLFGYYVIAPFAISFLAGYQIPGNTNLPTLSSYNNYMIMFTLPIGLVFELPVVVYFLSQLGLISPRLMRQYRRHIIVVILIVAGVITPSPDIVSQMLVGVPLYILFEVSILVSARVERQRKARQMIPM
jgi:sec-independent protein translocase protein TatC